MYFLQFWTKYWSHKRLYVAELIQNKDTPHIRLVKQLYNVAVGYDETWHGGTLPPLKPASPFTSTSPFSQSSPLSIHK